MFRKNKIFLFILIAINQIINGFLFAQENRQVDSIALKQQIQIVTKHISQADSLLNINRDSALQLYHKAIELSETYNLKKQQIASNLGAGIIFQERGNTAEAMGYFQKVYALTKNTVNIQQYAYSLEGIGTCHYYDGVTDSSLYYFSKALDIYKRFPNFRKTSAIYRKISNVYNEQGHYQQALDFLQKSLHLDELINDTTAIANDYNSIGYLYTIIKDYELAISYYQKSDSLFDKLNDEEGKAYVYLDLGSTYFELKDYNSALKYLLLASETAYKLHLDILLGYALSDIGGTYIELGEYEKAYPFCVDGLAIQEKIEYEFGIGYAKLTLGKYYSRTNNNKQAEELFNDVLEVARGIDFIDLEIGVVEELFILKEKEGKFEEALELHKKYFELDNELNNKENTKELTKLELNYYYEKEKQQTALENIQSQLMVQNELKKQEKIKNITFGLLIGVIIVVITVLQFYFALRKNHKLLHEKSNFIIQQKAEIILKSEELEKQRNEILKKNENLQIQQTEIQKQSVLLQELNNELEKLSIVARKTNNSVIIIKTDGSIEWFNNRFTEIFGIHLSDISKYNTEILFQKFKIQFPEKINECMQLQTSITYNSLNITQFGKEIWVRTTLTPIFGKENKIEIFIALDSDITDLTLAQQEIEKQRDQISKQKREITDSIRYASRIQKAMQPMPIFIRAVLHNYFILERPRDIISGDFYWLGHKNGKSIAAVADCTGHGVPGALMSMLGKALLKEIQNYIEIIEAADILDKLRDKVIHSLHQIGKEGEAKDGLDIALCVLDFKKNILQYAGANIPLYFVRNGVVTQIKADRMPIGIMEKEAPPFNNHTIELETNDMFYMFTDGYNDQFGGENNKKFLSKRLIPLLQNISSLNMGKQKETLEKTMIEWQGANDQIDDILVMGVKID